MARFIDKKLNWSKIVAIALTGASLSAPAFMATSAHAAPSLSDLANVLGIDRDRDGYDDRDYDRDGDIDNYGSNVTFQAVVTRDLNGDAFQVRTDTGRLVTVYLSTEEPSNLRQGSRVRVSGRDNGSQLTNASVRVLSNNNAYGNGGYNNGGYNNGGYNAAQVNVNIAGRVTNVQSDRRFTVRTADGSTYDVRNNSGSGDDINEGDRVRVVGTSRRGNRVVNATSVQLRGNRNGNENRIYRNDDFDAQRVDHAGTVRSIGDMRSDGRRTAVLETDDGRTIRFTTDNANVRRGSRIRIRGEMRGGVVVQPHID